MPTASNDGVSLHYEVSGGDGAADDSGTIVFVTDVGFGAWSWGWQHAALAGPFETVVWDLRGTGRSDCPPGPYDVATLVDDLEAVLADAGVRRAHLVGAGLGGVIALTYAHRFSRSASVTLVGTPASGDAVTDRLDDLRADPDGDAAALRSSLAAAFAVDLDEHPDVIDDIVSWRRRDDASLAGWDAQVAAMRSFDPPPLYEVTLPVLVVHGTEDEIVPPDAGEQLAEGLPRGEFQPIGGAGHAVYVEDSGTVTDAIDGFVRDVERD